MKCPGVVPQTDFSVARVSQEFDNRSSLGFLLVNKEENGSLDGEPDHYNRTYSVDGQLGLGDDGLLSGFFAKTDTPGLNGDDTALHLAAAADTQEWSYSASFTEVGKNFNPEVGFPAANRLSAWLAVRAKTMARSFLAKSA